MSLKTYLTNNRLLSYIPKHTDCKRVLIKDVPAINYDFELIGI